MPTNILLAPVGAGKTEVALDWIVRTIEGKPFATVWALLATRRQEDAFRHRLTEQDPNRHVFFNIEFFNFYQLYDRLLDTAGIPQRHLSDTARYGLLRVILQDMVDRGELQLFAPIAHTPGFIRIIADFIYELKQNRVYSDDFARIAQTRSAKDQELARIYLAYQDRLIQQRLVDKEGAGWLALDLLEGTYFDSDEQQYAHIAQNVDLLLVDGYDQFTMVQADLLTLLSQRVRETLITLTTVPEREDTIGRRFRQTLDRLLDRHEQVGEDILIADSPIQIDDDRHPDLQHLTNAIFRLNSKTAKLNGGIHFLEAPTPQEEVSAVLRQVKKFLLEPEAHTRPDDILIALRNWDYYHQHLVNLAQAYHLPLALHYGESLAQNPALVALLNLLQLPNSDFRRRDVLDVLRSPYFTIRGLSESAVEQLDRISRAYQVIGGRENWLGAIHRARQTADLADDEINDKRPTLTEAEADQLGSALNTFFDGIVPPEETASLSYYIQWLETLIGPDKAADPDENDADENTEDILTADPDDLQLHMLWQVRLPTINPEDTAASDDTIVSRDLAAMEAFKQILRSMLSAEELLKTLGEDQRIEWSVFFNDLKTAIDNTAVNSRPNRTGRVLVTSATNARGLPHDHLFILGLAEGIFPARLTEDSLYLDQERQTLREAGIYLETQTERAADDGLFYELLSIPRKTLTLSRPYIDDGKQRIESHLWRESQRVFGNPKAERIGIGTVVPAEAVASLDEALLAVADGLNQPADALAPPLNPLYNWLRTDARWSHIQWGRDIELGRMSRQPFNRYSGRLQDPDLIAQVGDILGPKRTWSASQFNEYGTCGFRFFAGRLLNLEALEDPDTGMDALQLGSLNHEILEKTYRELGEENIPITPEYVDRAVDTLRKIAAEVFPTAPEKYGFQPTALWEQEKTIILRKLETLVQDDFTEGLPGKAGKFNDTVRYPYRQEAPFGMKDGPTVWIDLGDDMRAIRVRGLIDRMDRQDNNILVMDYKTGSTGISTSEMEAGRNFQMMLYLRAAQVILNQHSGSNDPDTVRGGLFWHIGSRKSSGSITPDDDALKMAQQHLARHISAARTGDFAVYPSQPGGLVCTKYCAFSQLCRISQTNRTKRPE